MDLREIKSPSWVFKEMSGFRITDSWPIVFIRDDKTQESIMVGHTCHML